MTRRLRSFAFLPVVLVVVGCSGADGERAPLAPGGGGGAGGASGDGDGACEEGDRRSCKVVIHQASGVTSCWEGEQICLEAQWSDCVVTD